jgi:hypothetical protein
MKKNGSSSGRGNWQSKFPVHNPRGVFTTGNTRQVIFLNEFFFKKKYREEKISKNYWWCIQMDG